MRVRKLNESVKNAPANESFAVRHKNGNWVSKYYTVTSSSIPAKFNTREEAEKFISEDGKDPNWNKYYDIVELENEPLEEKLIEFDPNDWEEEDIKFWNHIDWQKNGYSDFARTDDTITAKVTKYSMHNDPETKEVTMCKYFRANPIYPPYYAAVEKPFDNCVGPMYDGHKAGKVDIHDRYETQEVYDLLSEAHNSNGEAQKLNTVLQDCDDLKSNAVEKKFSIEKAKENIIDIYDTIRTIIKDHNMPHNQIADYVNSFIDCADMSGKDVKDTMFRIGGDYIEKLFHSGNWNAYDFFRQKVDPNIKEIKHFIKNLCSKTNLTDRDIDFLANFATELAKKKTEANLERAINSVPTMSDTLVEDNVEETTGPKLPVTLLSAEQVRNIARTGLKKGKFISLGYLRKIPVAAQFASGKINKITGEVYPIVKIIKLIEDNGVTGIEYGQLKAIKKRNARTEAEVKQILGELTPEEAEEQSPVPTEWVVKNVIQIHPTTGNELLAYYPLGGTAKVKYYVSINGDDYKEVHRDDIRQWMTPGAAQKELEKTFDASMKGKYDNEENETVNFNYRLITQLYQLRQGDTVLGADFIKTPKRRNKLTLNNTDNVEEGFLSKKAVKGEANKLTDFLTANADKIKSLADCAPYILDDISDVTINTAAAKDSEEMNTMIDIAGACAKEFGYPNFETLRADDDVEVHFEAAKYLSKFVDARKLGQMIKEVRDEIADCERIEEDLLKEDLGEDVGEYQEWVDYDMKKYGRISKETFDKLRKADLTVVKDEYGDYEVIPHEKIHEACKKRKVDKKLEESIIYTSEGLNNAMKEFANVVRDWKKTHVDSQEEKVITESNWDEDSFNTFIATLEG